MMKKLFTLFIVLSAFQMYTEAKTVRALFLGNSYTEYNNLPELIKQMALSTGDTLIYSKNTPGGYRFQQHSTNPTSLALIAEGNWDYVILQEQSQLPSFPESQVAAQVYPYARALDSLVKVSNPCATTMFYMTWGRKFGDTENCPYVSYLCTYEGMDSALQLRYTVMAEDNHAAISPVAKVWREIRTSYPSIELYVSDNSHPSAQGSYAAAASFYTVLFGKNPEAVTYNYTVSPAHAATIRSVAKVIVYDSLSHWYRFVEDAMSIGFDYTFISALEVSFNNMSTGASSYHWDFGDGTSSDDMNPTHVYTTPGEYIVVLTITNECGQELEKRVHINIESTSNIDITWMDNLSIYPQPAQEYLNIKSAIPFHHITVYNQLGIQMEQMEFEPQLHFQFPVQLLKSGVYFIKIQASDSPAFIIKKFIKL